MSKKGRLLIEVLISISLLFIFLLPLSNTIKKLSSNMIKIINKQNSYNYYKNIKEYIKVVGYNNIQKGRYSYKDFDDFYNSIIKRVYPKIQNENKEIVFDIKSTNITYSNLLGEIEEVYEVNILGGDTFYIFPKIEVEDEKTGEYVN